MAAPPLTCPRCGTPIVPGGNFCQRCGSVVVPPPPPGTPFSGAAPLPSFAPPPAAYGVPVPFVPGPPAPPAIPYDVAKDRERTVTGLLLLVIGFAMGWILYVGIIGDLLALVGIILVIMGRRGYGPTHHRDVVIGGVLFVVVIIATVGLVIAFVVALFGHVSVATNGTVTFTTAGLQNDFTALFVAAAVIGVIGGVSQVVMVYALADRTTQVLLWLGFATSIALSIAILWILLPQVAPAVAQVTPGSSLNNGPLQSLENQSNLLGLTKVLPSLLFAWAYYRARGEAQRRASDPVS